MDISKRREIPPHIKQHFHAHAASGKTVKEYSIEAGIPPQTFYTWRKKYRKFRRRSNHSGSESGKQHFSTVGTISLQELQQPLFDIHFVAGHKVSIHRGTTAQEFAPFLDFFTGGPAAC